MNAASREVRRVEQEIALTQREFEVLEYLLRNQGQVVSREMLTRDLWKETSRFTPLDNVIDLLIASLRRKIDDNFTPKLLYTLRRLGFIMREGSA